MSFADAPAYGWLASSVKSSMLPTTKNLVAADSALSSTENSTMFPGYSKTFKFAPKSETA